MEKKLAYIDVDCYLTGDDEFSSALEEGLINDEITKVELSKAGCHLSAVIYAPFEKLRKFMIGNYFANEADFEEGFRNTYPDADAEYGPGGPDGGGLSVYNEE